MKTLTLVLIMFMIIVSSSMANDEAGSKGNDDNSTTTERWLSPDRKVESLELRTADFPVELGKRKFSASSVLLLRFKNSEDSLCLGHYKFFEVYWSPDSKYLVVLKEYFTHNSDVDIYKVETEGKSTLTLKLIFRRDALNLPDGESWVSWDFVKWDLAKGIVRLEEWNENHLPKRAIKQFDVPLNAKPIRTVQLIQQE